MPEKSAIRIETGKLVSAIQKEWINLLGTEGASEAEQILHKAQALLRHTTRADFLAALEDGAVRDFLGRDWVGKRPVVQWQASSLDAMLTSGQLLATARMTLTDVTDDDFVATYAMDQDPLVSRYLGDGQPETRPFTEYRDFMRARLASWTSGQFHMWVMRPHGSDAFLGWAMLKPIKDTPHVEVGYRMPQCSWGKGYATEAALAVLDYGFNVAGFDEITAVMHPDNAASQHVLTKCGLQRDGTLNYNGRGEIPFFRLSKQDFVNTHGN